MEQAVQKALESSGDRITSSPRSLFFSGSIFVPRYPIYLPISALAWALFSPTPAVNTIGLVSGVFSTDKLTGGIKSAVTKKVTETVMEHVGRYPPKPDLRHYPTILLVQFLQLPDILFGNALLQIFLNLRDGK